MKIFSANEAAVELGVDPRALRRFLRTNASYRNAGMGGRYQFTESELGPLRRAFFSKHPVKKPAVVDDDPHILDDDPGVPLTALGPRGLPAQLRAERQAARAQRQQRLVIRMRDVGVGVVE